MNISWFADADILQFPPHNSALKSPDGLLAAGGNLSVATLKEAYSQGVFPWFADDQPILWWSPSERAVIDTAKIHVSKNMRKLMRQQKYSIACDTRFAEVVQNCSAATVHRESTWITREVQQAYQVLFEHNIAHSIEVYRDGELVGGLYGVFCRNCFCGESMFSCESNTSKLALIYLAQLLRHNGCELIDCQMPTEHLKSMGAYTVPREQFLGMLRAMKENKFLLNTDWNNYGNNTWC